MEITETVDPQLSSNLDTGSNLIDFVTFEDLEVVFSIDELP